MKARTKRRIRRTVVTLMILYLAGGFILFFIQDILLFHPLPLKKDHRFSFDLPFQEVNIPSGKETTSILQFKPAGASKGLVLFFHGNMYNMEHYKHYPVMFTRNGYEIWMMDYPGFGKSTGRRTERILEKQALFFYDLAIRKIHADSIVIYGKSIGTGVACWLASNRECKRLVLETPYYSVEALARHYFPIYPAWMTRYSFAIHSYLEKIHSPVNIIHGTDDETIPYHQSEQLKNEHPSTELIAIEGGHHNDLSRFSLFQKKIDSLFSK